MKNNSKYFKNSECEYFPCHKVDGDYFNCMFCCCPLFVLGDKCGARLSYGGKFEIYDGATLETIAPEYDIPNMYLLEDSAFIESVNTGVKNRNHIENILESAKLLDVLYKSAEKRAEIEL